MESFQDYLVIGALIFAFAIAGVVVTYMYSEVSSNLVNMTTINSSHDAVSVINNGNSIANRLDYVIFVIFIALVLALIIGGYFSGMHPILMIVYIILIIIAVILGSILSNTWDLVMGQSTFITTLTKFPITNHLLTNLPLYTVITGFVGFLASFLRLSQQ